jgi:hypothetical protein
VLKILYIRKEKTMKEHFKEQLKTCNPISEEILPELKGKSIYSDYEIDDKVVSFLCQELGENEPPYTVPSITLILQTITERELDKLENDYKFIRMSKIFPVLQRR